MLAVALEGCFFQGLAGTRVGDTDEKLGTFLQAFAIHLYGTEFGDYPVYLAAWGAAAGAEAQ